MNGFNLSTISDVYVGSTQASAIYLGTALIWERATSTYLTITALDSISVKYGRITPNQNHPAQYSLDGGTTWTNFPAYDSTTWSDTTVDSISMNLNDHMLIRDDMSNVQNFSSGGEAKFIITGAASLNGNIMSLSAYDDYSNATTLSANQFKYLFQGCKIANASNLMLPVTALADNCYESMFKDCDLLVAPPSLPATTLAESCYYKMFENCQSLASTPSLPANILSENCYARMFKNCTSLVLAPSMPYTTPAELCCSEMFSGCESLTTGPVFLSGAAPASYLSMFEGCTSLIHAPLLEATTLAPDCYSYMFRDCTDLTYLSMKALNAPAGTLIENCMTDILDNVGENGNLLIDQNAQWDTSAILPATWSVLYFTND